MQKVGVIAKVRWDSPNTRSNSYTQNIEYITRGLDEHEKQEVLEWNEILDKIKNDSSNEQGFSRYLDYIERQEVEINIDNKKSFKTRKSSVLATDNGFNTKSGKEGLFDFYNDVISSSQRNFYNRKFDEAYKNGGLLWKPIVSFDNEWLKEHGVLVNNIIDEEKLKDTARKMMTSLLKERQMENKIYWVAQLHYDTDNIHFHVAMVEKNPTNVMDMSEEEEKDHGFFSQTSINQMKSTCVRELTDRSKEKQQIHDVARKRILGVAKETQFKEDYLDVFQQLSERLSTYHYKNLKPHEKKWINTLSYAILENHFPNEYQRFVELTSNEQEFYRRAYGDRSSEMFKDYSQNCEKDLLQRLGNTLLKQIKEYKNSNHALNDKSSIRLSDELFKSLVYKEDSLQSIKQKERENARSFSYSVSQENPVPNRLDDNLYNRSQTSSPYTLNQLNYHINKLKRVLERDVNKALREYEKLLYQQEIQKEGEYDSGR